VFALEEEIKSLAKNRNYQYTLPKET